MTQTLINTLRFADRLKEAGFVGPQAEALARTLGDELTEQLPSKADFQELRADFKTLETKVDALDAKVDALEASLNGRVDALESRLDGRIDALESNVNGQIETLAGKIDAQRYALNVVLVVNGLFLALVSVILALGLAEPVSKLFGS